MMSLNKTLLIAASLLAISCAQIAERTGGMMSKLPSSATQTEKPEPILAGVAAIRVFFGPQDSQGRGYIAQSQNGANVTYGQNGRSVFVLNGGLIVEAHAVGRDLLGVAPNANDPIMNKRPVANWPQNISRSYRLFGNGVDGKTVNVACNYSAKSTGVSQVQGRSIPTTLMDETCKGSGFTFKNSYMVDGTGFIWKSEQWAGDNAVQAIVEILEPLD